MMRQISERNYFGMSVPNEPLESLESRVYDAVARLRRRYHLHTERVYVAGIASGGTQALRLGLMRPEWFGGIAAVSARCPAEEHLLQRYDELRGKPVFLGVAPDDGAALATDVCRLQRLLWSAGMDVSACAADAGPAPSASILRQIDRWIMNVME
jgi:phospholipase/carboxylesterase